MRVVIKQGKDGKFRAMLQNRHDNTVYVPVIQHAYDDPGRAAVEAEKLITEITDDYEGVFTEAGYRWIA